MWKTTFWKLMRSIGFRYKVRNNKRQLYERQAVIASRADYLRQVRAYRAAGRPIVYLDETWCNQHHSLKRAWTSGDVAPADVPSGKGKRLIILHAGSSEGWIPGAELVFVGKKGSGDYHDEMNAAHFEDWWKNQLLPNLPPDARCDCDRQRTLPQPSDSRVSLSNLHHQKGRHDLVADR